jgi:hypothetical protein
MDNRGLPPANVKLLLPPRQSRGNSRGDQVLRRTSAGAEVADALSDR